MYVKIQKTFIFEITYVLVQRQETLPYNNPYAGVQFKLIVYLKNQKELKKFVQWVQFSNIYEP